MNSKNIFTKKIMNIDKNVLFTMLIAFLLCFGFLGYTITKTNKETPCKPFDILIFGQRNAGNKIYYNDNPISFRVTTNIGDKVSWDFSDNSPKTDGAGTRHTFTEQKVYLVTATINGICQSSIKINISKKENIVFDSSGEAIDPIAGEPEAFVNEPVTFTTPISSSLYEWSIDKPGYATKKSKTAIFTFKTVGTYTVKLLLDNDTKKEYEYSINVKPINRLIPDDDKPVEMPVFPQKDNKPPVESNEQEPVPQPPVEQPPVITSSVAKSYTVIPDEILKDYLQDYLCGRRTLQSLSQYCCDVNNTSVTITGEKVIRTTLADLNATFKGKRDVRILSINQVSRSSDKCITGFIIYIERTKQKKACPDN